MFRPMRTWAWMPSLGLLLIGCDQDDEMGRALSGFGESSPTEASRSPKGR